MTALYGLIAAVLVLAGAQGLRMVRADVSDDLLAEQAEVQKPRKKETGMFTRVLDFIGARTQRLLISAYGPKRLARLESRLRQAGRPEGLTRDVFLQREAGFIVLGLVILLLMAVNGQGFLGLVAALMFATWMQLWLITAARKRSAEIDRDLTDFLDVLAVTVSAGLSFRAALDRVSREHDGALAEEMRTALQEMQLGVPRRDAFSEMRDRTKSPGVAAFVTALLQAEELGTPLADALVDISKEARRESAQQVRQAAAKAQPRVSLVVTTTIVPGAIILMVAGLVVINWDTFSGIFNG